MITKKQRLILVYFITRAMFLGIGVTFAILKTKQDAWISCVIGLVLGMCLSLIISYICKNKHEKNIKDFLKDMKIGGILLIIFLVIYAIFMIIITILIIQTYTTSFFLLQTPLWLISIPLLILVYIICNKGITVIGKVSEILFPISITFFVISALTLIPLIDIKNFLPILTTKPLTIITTSFYVAGISATPSLLLIQTSDDGKKLVWPYVLGVLTILGVVVCTIGVMGPTLSATFRFPEYMVLKRINIFDFIQKVENILSLAWVVDLFILMTLSGMFIKNLLPMKRNNWYFIGILLFILFISTEFFGKNYYLDLFMMQWAALFLLGFFIIIVIPLLIYVKIKKK